MTEKKITNLNKVVDEVKKVNLQVINALPVVASERYEAKTPKAARISKWLLWIGTGIGLLNTAGSMFVGAGLPGIPEDWSNYIAWSVPVTAFLGYTLDFFKSK